MELLICIVTLWEVGHLDVVGGHTNVLGGKMDCV